MKMTIGEKVRKARKEQKLTQSQLAGDEMTKSMLSQIENNNASPSMKNLRHLANKLGKPIAYFLEESYQERATIDNHDNTSLPIEEINQLFKEANILMDKLEMEKAKEILEGLLDQYTFDKKSKIYGDIILMLGSCLSYLTEFERSEKYIKEAINIFENDQLYIEAAKAYMDLALRSSLNFNYKESLEILDKAYAIYEKSVKEDIFFEVEFLRVKALFLSAIGNIDETLSVLNSAINMSNKTNLYYKSDDLYRLRASLYLLKEEYDSFVYNIEKARKFAEFTENNMSLSLIEFILAVYENDIGNPSKALERLSQGKNFFRNDFYFYNLEKARSLYLLERYYEALEMSNKIDYSQPIIHTADFLNLWRGKVYEGLILHKLGRSTEGIKVVNAGIEKMKTMPPSKYLAFGYKSLSEIYSDIEDYENAFNMLKNANAIESNLKGVPY